MIKLCSPKGPSAYQLAKESGISQSSLLKWKEELGNTKTMNKQNRRPKDWTPEEKLKAVVESLPLDGKEELGAFLREKGIHSNQLEEWKAEALGAVSGSKKVGRGRPKKNTELASLEKENKFLKKDLRRKEKALAESAALLWLKKKATEIWGDGEDEE